MNRGRTLYLARKRLGIFLAFTSSFPFSQCNSQPPCGSAAFPSPLCVSLLFCLRSCGFPARHQLPVAGKKPLGKAARPPGRLLAEIIPAGCASLQLAAVCSRERLVEVPKYRCCRAIGLEISHRS